MTGLIGKRAARAVLASALALGACGDDPTSSGDPLPGLTVSPASAPMAAPVALAGFDPALIAGREVGVLIGDQPAAALALADGTVRASVPLFLEGAVPAPPSEAVDVTLLADGVPVAALPRSLTVEPLPTAPGASQAALAHLTTISDALIALVDASEEAPGPEGQYLFAVSRTVAELVQGDDPTSLASQLAALAADPAELAVFDGWLTSSGMLAALEQFSGLVAQVGPSFARTPPTARSGAAALPNYVSDVGLAFRMQLYEVAKLFGETVVAPTATTYANTVALLGGALALAGPTIPAAAGIGAILSVTDFVINKVAVGLLPAKVDAFTLVVASALLDPGEVTDAVVRVVASNDPPPITVQDLIGQVLNALGVAAGEAQSFRDELASIAAFFFSTMQSFIAQYASANPAANLDVALVSVPAMTWEAEVSDPQLVELHSTDADIVAGLPGAVNWKASTDNQGQASISARSAIGPVFLSLPPGFEYNGGVFGDDVVQTEATLVSVEGNFGGSFVGTYSGAGGCENQPVGGAIAFTIAQTGLTLDVGYSINPAVEGLTIFGGQATIVTSSSTSFSGTITQPPQVTGTFTGQLSEDRTTISGTVAGGATVLCDGVPTPVGFTASYQGVRQ